MYPYPVERRMPLRIKRLSPEAKPPARATEGAACFDLHAVVPPDIAFQVAHPGKRIVVDTGLAFEVPPGFVMKVYSRSGHGFKSGVRLANAVGIIDADFRGPVKVALVNDGDEPFMVRHGDRIAQAMLVELPTVEIIEVDELSDTARGTGGLGSTGA